MIEILINNTALDLSAGAATNFQQNSPFFDASQIQGEYSLPIDLPFTEKNIRLLGFVSELAVSGGVRNIPNVVWAEDGIPMYQGTLIIESVQVGAGGVGGTISAYFVCGISAFWQLIKDMKMRDIDMGSDFNFKDWAAFSAAISASYTATSDTCDYAFPPILNDKAGGATNPDWGWMNGIKLVPIVAGKSSKAQISEDNSIHIAIILPGGNPARVFTNTLVPMPYLVVVMKNLFKTLGYSLTGDMLNDPDFKKIILPNFQTVSQFVSAVRAYSFNLKNHLPDMSIGDFILSLRNKFGIGFQFDTAQRTCRLIDLNNILKDGLRIDLSTKVNPSSKKNFTDAQKIFSFTQVFDENDTAIETPDFSKVNYKGEINNMLVLPQATGSNENDCYLCVWDNMYYCNSYNSTTFKYEWVKFADNIYDFTPANSTDSVETKATCLGMMYTTFIKNSNFRAYFPICSQELNFQTQLTAFKPWTLRLMFYHGMQTFTDGATQQTITYPYCSNHNYFWTNILKWDKIGNWKLSYTGGTDNLIAKFWQNWLKVLGNTEEVDFTIYQKVHELLNANWSDILLVKNVPFLVSQRTQQSPYNGQIAIKAVPIPL